MGKWQKTGTLLTIFLVGLVTLYLIFGGTNGKKQEVNPKKEEVAAEKLPDMEFSGTKLSQVVDEKINWELDSKSVIMDKEKNLVKFQKSKGVFYNQGKEHLDLEAEKGFFDLNSKDITLEGNVLVVSKEGEKLQAQKIKWIAVDQKIQGAGQVVFVRGNTKVLGERFETDLGLENIEIKGNVRVIIGGD